MVYYPHTAAPVPAYASVNIATAPFPTFPPTAAGMTFAYPGTTTQYVQCTTAPVPAPVTAPIPVSVPAPVSLQMPAPVQVPAPGPVRHITVAGDINGAVSTTASAPATTTQAPMSMPVSVPVPVTGGTQYIILPSTQQQQQQPQQVQPQVQTVFPAQLPAPQPQTLPQQQIQQPAPPPQQQVPALATVPLEPLGAAFLGKGVPETVPFWDLETVVTVYRTQLASERVAEFAARCSSAIANAVPGFAFMRAYKLSRTEVATAVSYRTPADAAAGDAVVRHWVSVFAGENLFEPITTVRSSDSPQPHFS